jgi:lysozyme
MAFPAGATPGIDVSHYQAVVDWTTVMSGGDQFGFAKASEGTNVADRYFSDNWLGMKAAGMFRGAYHFFHPSMDAVEQADNFLECLANANNGTQALASGDLPVALDIEVTDGVAPATLLAGALTWLQAIEAATGKQPIVYTYVSFWVNTLGNPADLSNYPLWIAQLGVASPTVPGQWPTWLFWQFDQQPLSGVPSAVVDLDAFNGSPADLGNFAG